MPANHFSKQLTLMLDRLGMTRYRLARLSKLSPSYIGLLAAGERLPGDDALKKLATALGGEYAELKAWVEASRLGEEGLADLRRRLDAPLPVLEGLLPALTAYASDGSDESALLGALRQASGAIGVSLWRLREGALQITAQAGLPSEYVRIANLRFKEQGLVRGELFPAVDAYLSGTPLTVTNILANPAYPLHFYAKTLGFDVLLALPVAHGGKRRGVLAVYLPTRPQMSLSALQPWLELAAALLARSEEASAEEDPASRAAR